MAISLGRADQEVVIERLMSRCAYAGGASATARGRRRGICLGSPLPGSTTCVGSSVVNTRLEAVPWAPWHAEQAAVVALDPHRTQGCPALVFPRSSGCKCPNPPSRK